LSSISILIADDYQEWRRTVCELLRSRPEWQVVCEVSDGAEAVQKARELKPDLIVLDIGLPRLNGLEAARHIRQRSPSSKIVFLSMDNSLDVVQVALSTGAHGYVYKADAGRELLPAIDAVLRGEQFVTSVLKGLRRTDASGAKAPHRHEVLFYSDDEVFLDSFTRFIAAALEAGDVVIVIATESHRDSLIQRLNAHGLDVDAAIKEGTYISVNVVHMLSAYMINEMPDAARLFEVAGGLIRAAAKAGKREHPRVAVCGEAVSLLVGEGKADAAIRLEQLWNQLATIYEIDILCGYALSRLDDEDESVFQSICAEHSAVFRGEVLTANLRRIHERIDSKSSSCPRPPLSE
jgi:DNA-binding NarL/FixJ family response regulator